MSGQYQDFPEIMSLNQARQFLHLHIDTVKKLFIDGIIPARPTGVREWKVFKGDLIEYIRSGNKRKESNP